MRRLENVSSRGLIVIIYIHLDCYNLHTSLGEGSSQEGGWKGEVSSKEKGYKEEEEEYGAYYTVD